MRSRPSSIIMAENEIPFLSAASATTGDGHTPGSSRSASAAPPIEAATRAAVDGQGTDGQTNQDLQRILTLLVQGQLNGKRGGKLPEPGSKQLPLFGSKGITDYLETFNFYARQGSLSDPDRLEQFPIFCEKPIRTLVQSMADEAKNKGGWPEFEKAVKREFWAEDPEQTEEATKRIVKWLDRLRFSTNGAKFRQQRREFERLLKKAGDGKGTTRYTKDLMVALRPEIRSVIFQRLGKTRHDVDTVPYEDMMEQLNNYMSEQTMGADDEDDSEIDSDGSATDPPTRRGRDHDKPREKSSKEVSISILKRAPSNPSIDALASQFAQMQVKLNELAARPAIVPGPAHGSYQSQQQLPYDNMAGQQYPMYQQNVQQEYRQPQRGRGRGGMSRGNYYGNGRGQGYNRDDPNDFRCYYCGQLGHALYDCGEFDRDCQNGIVHRDRVTNCIHFGGTHELGLPIPNSIFHHFKESGCIRRVVWSLLELYPNRHGAAAMRRAISETGERVSTDMQFTSSRYTNPGPIVPAEPIGGPATAGQQEEVALPSNYLMVYDDASFTTRQFQPEDTQLKDTTQDNTTIDNDMFNILLNGVKRGRVSSLVDDDGTEILASGATPDQNSRSTAEEIVATGLSKSQNAYENGGTFASLVETTARAAMDSKMKLSLHQVGQLNSMVARHLADTFSDMADSIENTIHVDFSGGVMKEVRGPGPASRKRIKLADVTSDRNPDVVPVNMQQTQTGSSRPGGLVNALGQLRVIIGNTMLEGAALSVIVDSGSAANTISEANALKAGLAIAPTAAVSRSFHGTLSRFRGTAITNVWIGGHALTMRFFVNPTPQAGGEEDRPLFGMPFFHLTKFTFSYGDHGELFGKMVVGHTRIVMPMIADQGLMFNASIEDSGKD
jgi:hypothetical protein